MEISIPKTQDHWNIAVQVWIINDLKIITIKFIQRNPFGVRTNVGADKTVLCRKYRRTTMDVIQ